MSSERENHPIAAPGENLLGRFAYAACATPPGESGIAIIRMAGSLAFAIADRVFKSISPKYATISEMSGYSCAYGVFCDPVTSENLDTVILTKFIAPNSFTGEDTIEISCHGGGAVKNAILQTLYSCGANPAQPGEFSKHAFLNGKMDLSQAEAVMDLISSTARKASVEANRQIQGVLSEKIHSISRKIYSVMSKVEMIVEFPEHEETADAAFDIDGNIQEITKQIDDLAQSFHKGRILKEGLNVVIAGKPNAGKSSMLNALAGYDRAIVTSIPGTTRDTIEELVDINGLPVRLVDTAGLRESTDEVERIGMNRARKAIETADLVFWISDGTRIDNQQIMDQDDLSEIVSCHQERSLVLVIGKSDIPSLEPDRDRTNLREAFPNAPILSFSAVTLDGLEDIRALIRAKYEESGAQGSEEVLITNARHYHALLQAWQALLLVSKDSTSTHRIPWDLLATVLRSAADSLALITGDTVSEELVNEIFSRFCIGK